LVNLTGLKKRDPLDERLQLAEELLPEIVDSAEKPLTVSWTHCYCFDNKITLSLWLWRFSYCL